MNKKEQDRAFLAFGTLAVVAIFAPNFFQSVAHAADLVAEVLPSVTPSPFDSGVPVIMASATPLPSSTVVAAAAVAADISGVDFLTQVWAFITGVGGMSFLLKVSGIITIVIASLKVSFMRPIWDKLGYFKTLAAPLLSLILGIVSLAVAGKVTLAAIVAYVISGGGAVFMHQVLDTIKAIPGLSPMYLNMITFFTKILGGQTPSPADKAIPAGMGTASNPSGSVVPDAVITSQVK